MADSYPLKWPDGWPRTSYRKSSNYKISIDKAVDDLMRELTLLGALKGSIVLSSNVPPRNALGTPRNDGHQVADPGVSVWWTTKAHGERVIACDRWASVRENVRAVGLAVEALRAIERAGATQILERAFSAFGALPAASAAPVVRPWWAVLGFSEAAIGSLSSAVTDARWRELAKKAHPDQGGTQEAMAELNAAAEQARQHYARGQ
jgi:hypothetical protein